MSSDNEIWGTLIKTVLISVGAICALFGVMAIRAIFLGGPLWSESHWHREAVNAGKAEYYLDEHHERQWRWKP